MDSSNANNFVIEDSLNDLSSFTEVSSIGMDIGQITEKMQKIETELLELKNAKNHSESSMIAWQMGVKYGKIEKEVEELHEENGKLKGQMNEMKNEMGQLKEENETMKNQIAGMKVEFAEKISGLTREYAKLNREIIEKQNADKETPVNFIENHKINTQQIPLKFDSIEMKNNKMDLADCAPKLIIIKNDLLVSSYGYSFGWKCVRAILPVPEFNRNAKEAYIAFYFEGHIQETTNLTFNKLGDIGMGFCSYEFPREGNYIGKKENSIGITRKEGMLNCGKWESFQQDKDPFLASDKIGLGLTYEPKNGSIKCFAICNRKLLGSVELPAKFFDVKIFPVVSIRDVCNSILLNFGQEDWDFDPRQIIPLIH